METINLLNEKDFEGNIDATGKFTGFDMSNNGDMTSILVGKLLQGQKEKKLIYTQDLRCIGKTYQLIKFAKLNGYAVIIRGISPGELIKEFDYKYIYSIRNKESLRGIDKRFVIDEGVEIDTYFSKIDIATGFTNVRPILSKAMSFHDNIISGLKLDAERLSSRLKGNSNDSEYKMLVNNLKTTMELIQELQGKNINPITFNISNLELPDQNSSEDFVKSLEQFSRVHK